MIIEVISFATAAVLFLLLSLVLMAGRRDQPQKILLAIASFASALWASVVSYQAAYGGLLSLSQSLELFRALAWFAFLLLMAKTTYRSSKEAAARFRVIFFGISAFILGLMMLALYRISGGSVFSLIAGNDVLAGYLLVSVGGLVIVEQLYRNTPYEYRRALKYLCLAVGGMFAYDFYLYSDAMLFQRIDGELWGARGFIHAMVVPVIAIALKRNLKWAPDKDSVNLFFISRRIAFHTTALIGAGIYLLAMGIGGYFVRILGGSWGLVAQAIFLFGAALVLAILLFSGQLRASLRVLISKNFFHYKYDYREEWLRFIHSVSSGCDENLLHLRAIRAIAQIIGSPGGLLWIRKESEIIGANKNSGDYKSIARWNMEPVQHSVSVNNSMIRFLEEQQWVLSLDEYEQEPGLYKRLANLEIPKWVQEIPDAWLIVPLILHERLLGFIILARSNDNYRHFNWEDSDLLKIAGRQVASHLVQHQASQALAEARRFDEFNKMSAYIIHDLKNLIAQLSLVVNNAAKHKNNPMFMDDAVDTVENSVDKMSRLLTRLRGGVQGDSVSQVNLPILLREIVESRKKVSSHPNMILRCYEDDIYVTADRDRLTAIMGHVIQNAQDATPQDGRIKVGVTKISDCAVIDVKDTGCGMDEAFLRARLFRPFETTKGSSGMGIGVYETREYVHAMGGEIDVKSHPGKGTRFRIKLPLSASGDVVKLVQQNR